MTHLRPLDGLRGVAVLAVVLYHFSPDILPAGFLGVDVFFVLSGFLITSLLVLEFEGTGRIAMWAFWARRARRLLPALLLVVIVVAAYVVFFARPVEAQHISDDGLGTLFYVANWHFIISDQPYIVAFADQAASPLRHMWSLAIEEQFYFVWPLVVAGLGALVARGAGRSGRQRRTFRRVVLTVSVVIAAASLLRMTMLYDPLDPNRVYYGTDTRVFAMLFGAALGALTAGSLTIATRVVQRLLVIAGCVAAVGLAAVMATLTITSSWLYTGGYGVVAAAMLLVLFASAQPGANPLAVVFSWTPLVGLGLISYGVYLWQWPATVWITESGTGTSGIVLFALRSAATLAAALLSYWLVEQPIRQRRLPRVDLKSLSPAVVPLSCVTVISVILLVPSMTLPTVELASPIPASRTVSAVTTAYAASAPHCAPGTTADPIVSDRELRVQFLGNSLAVESFPCLKRALAARNAAATGVMQVGFPICDLLPALKESLRDPAERPDIGIVFAAPAVDPTCEASGWEQEMKAVIAIWKKAGVHTFLVADLPVAGSADWDHERAINEKLARRDPEHVTALDGGLYLQDDRGVFQAQMPCVPADEPGCRQGLVYVRSTVDQLHFCSETNWGVDDECPVTGAAGIRRLVASIIVSLTQAMQPDPTQFLRTGS